MSSIICKQIYKKIKEYDTIVIARHIGPDPDAIASQTSLKETIKESFPNKQVYAVGANVSKFKFYGNLDKLPENLSNALLITCDVPNIDRIDGVLIKEFKEVIKIDHHPYEEDFGGLEWIDASASSTSQLLVELIFNTKLKLTKKVAKNLFLGIVSDSDRFLLSYTSSKTFYLISRLIEETQIDIGELYHNLYERPISEVKFQGYLSENLTITDNGLGYIKITTEVLKKYPFPEFENENFVTEEAVWNAIAADGYYLRWHKDIIYICNYLDDGLTKSGNAKYINNPQGVLYWVKIQMRAFPKSTKKKLSAVNRYYEAVKHKKTIQQVAKDIEISVLYCRLAVLAAKLKRKFKL